MAAFGPPERLLREILRLQLHQSRRHVVEMRSTSSGSGTYKAAACVELGKPVVMLKRDRPTILQSGEVRVKIKAAAINFADILTCKGEYQDKKALPWFPGSEIAGDVLQVGPDVTNFKAGDRVFGMPGFDNGGYAEEAVVNEMFIQKMPLSVDYSVASSVIVSYATAHTALTRKANIQPGETVLVTAAAGATGLATVDLAAHVFNCTVIAACSSKEKFQVCLDMGAKHVIDYSTESIRERVKAITGGQGVNIAVDMVGGDIWDQCVKSIGFEGRLLVIGFASGTIPSMKTNQMLLKSSSVSGIWWGNYLMRGHPVSQESISAVAQLLADGKIRPCVSDQFPLSQVNEAFELIMKRKNKGKVVLLP